MTRWRDESAQVSASTGFITALWASGGLALLSAAVLESPTEMGRHWLTVFMFVAGTYLASYIIGARLFRRRVVRTNIFMSWFTAFAVSEAVLFFGAMAGGSGALLQALLRGEVSGEVWAYPLGAPLLLCLYGVMFTGPLSLGLGLHVRLWSHWSGTEG